MKIARMLLLLTMLPGFSLIADEKPDVIWSVDLRTTGIGETVWKGAYWGVHAGVAASASTVAVALRCPSSPLTKGSYRGQWEVRLLVFDKGTGKLLAQRGPWRDVYPSVLRSTARGNFLLFLQPMGKASEKPKQIPKEILLLLSPSGEELKRMDLEQSRREGILSSPKVYLSSTGGTLLVEAESDNGRQYQVLAADSLELGMQWSDKAETIWAVAISDEGMLGHQIIRQNSQGNRWINRQKFFLGRFGESWRDFSSSRATMGENEDSVFLPSNFLINGQVFGPVCDKKDCTKVVVAQTDGKIVSRYMIPKSSGFKSTRSATVMKDGRYLTLERARESDLSRWWDSSMDMWSFGVKYFVYIWDAKMEDPIAKITLGERLHAYCFVEGETPELAVLDGPNLKLLSIETKGAAN